MLSCHRRAHIVAIDCAARSAFAVNNRDKSIALLQWLQQLWWSQSTRIMDNQGGNRQIKRQCSVVTQQLTIYWLFPHWSWHWTKINWRDAMHRSSCRQRRNYHLDDTEASQKNRNITSAGPHHYPRNDQWCDATCKGQPEDADHSQVLGQSHTGRQIRCASRANTAVQSSH